ncbi:MAG: hypothetical protein JRJ77_09230 [Deltaproteobacteria bacterium]|nr:hypothetical protein [Deltaproteobacteria bacterium]
MRRLWNRYPKLSILVWLLPVISTGFLVQCAGLPKIPSLEGILEGEPPITTSLSDAVTEVPFLDDFDPRHFVSMTVLPRDPKGGFLLRPGLFRFNAESYCLHAGKYVPGGGDGYLYAPLKGPRSDIIGNILQRSVDHPEVPQRDIQTLLWAILTRTKISDMSHEIQLTAAELLTPEEIFEINGGAMGLIPEELLEKALAKLPPQVRQVLEAEARLREMLTEAKATYEELERVAVRFGDAPLGEGSREIPIGRWSYHSDGYFIRYFPSGYSSILIQVYVPELFQIERDELGRITRIADGKGNQIETKYDDTIGLLTVPGDPAMQGYAFRSIRFVCRKIIPPEVVLDLEATWDAVGWTLVGVPSGKGCSEPSSERFADLKDRYEWANTHKNQLNKLNEQFAPKGSIRDIVDLGHYAVALAKAISGDHTREIKWASNHIDLVKKAWQYAVCKREGGCNTEGASFGSLNRKSKEFSDSRMLLASSQSTKVYAEIGSNEKGSKGSYRKYDPAGNDAVPGNTSRQRLGISPRSSDDKDEVDEACQTINDHLLFQALMLKAFQDQGLYDAIKDMGLGWEHYQEAVKNLAKKAWDSEQWTSFDNLSNAEKAEILKSYWPPAGESPMHTDCDCNIVENWDLDRFIEEDGELAGKALYRAARTHEQVHRSTCMRATPRFFCLQFEDIEFGRNDEIKAYNAGIDEKEKSLKELGCK